MPRRKTTFSPGSIYHIYNHGARHSDILVTPDDFRSAHNCMEHYAQKLDLEVPVWCFMPNHYHWLVIQRGTTPALKLPYHVFNVYTRWFNKTHTDRGTLFESRFKVKPVTTRDYLAHLCLYIHANPVKAALCDSPHDWPWSNLGECLLFPPHPLLASVFPSQDAYREKLLAYCTEAAQASHD